MTKIKTFAAAVALASLFTGPVALADHNSIFGEGTANMPNDIHNTRIDTMGDDGDAFADFVRYGGGADSVNRFLDDDSSSLVASMGGGSVDTSRGASAAGGSAMGGSDVTRGGSRR
ncbi:hypothetical protein Tgr7_0253 [Thioalkalivibrio sulfidiphilus HL-EbGr7]|uniref:Phage infection protein n=1 Tax=Thioalkalivibrio sulfidiphilus (strain HL-EbGR7) TaxID=396588 RepID=B8GU69_THISH|nr:hypothetical protein [Thioalkalivibrio sulfidiphilus]ACL71352.1 hypothetical protein Tgr7_0253 [Thioalkalivibrio sulfidiphilus HL-EbGr7]